MSQHEHVENPVHNQLQKVEQQNEMLEEANKHLRRMLQHEQSHLGAAMPKEFHGNEDISITQDLNDSFKESKDADRAARRLSDQEDRQSQTEDRQLTQKNNPGKDPDFASTKCDKDAKITKSGFDYSQIQCDARGKPELWTVGFDGKLINHKSVSADNSVLTESFRPLHVADWTKPTARIEDSPKKLDLKAAMAGQFRESLEKDFSDKHFELTNYELNGAGKPQRSSFLSNDLHKLSSFSYIDGKLLGCKITMFDSAAKASGELVDGKKCEVERF